MQRRFDRHGVLDRVRFVDAIVPPDPAIERLRPGVPRPRTDAQTSGELACLASHLKTLRHFLLRNTTSSGVIVCEDDVMLHRDFGARYAALAAQIPPSADVVVLASLLRRGFPATPLSPSLHRVQHWGSVWGTQMYYLSRPYAERVLREYDRPFAEHPFVGERRTASWANHNPEHPRRWSPEMWLQVDGVLAVVPPLGIEESRDTHIRGHDTREHARLGDTWGRRNYADDDDVAE